MGLRVISYRLTESSPEDGREIASPALRPNMTEVAKAYSPKDNPVDIYYDKRPTRQRVA